MMKSESLISIKNFKMFWQIVCEKEINCHFSDIISMKFVSEKSLIKFLVNF